MIIEDSRSVQDLLIHILNSDPHVEVIGTADNGKQGLKFLETRTPDVITMDIDMPELNGLEATKIIMETKPVPIIVVTASLSTKDVNNTYQALDLGAVSVLEKPRGLGHPDHHKMAAELIQNVKTMAGVKLVRRRPNDSSYTGSSTTNSHSFNGFKCEKPKIHLVAIGASTGGPPAIQTILSNLPKNLSVPVVIVQHIANGFLNGLIDWLISTTGHKIHIAADREKIEAGHIYVAPNDFQMGVSPEGYIHLKKGEPGNHLCPSVSYLFRSLAQNFGQNTIGILLTGMGKDGAEGIRHMKNIGGITIAQDKDSSIVYGMPREALATGAVDKVLKTDEIKDTLIELLGLS